jgi:hypothetical protein
MPRISRITLVVLMLAAVQPAHAQQSVAQENLRRCISGNYPTLCEYELLTPEQRVEARAAEARVNARRCISGNYPTLCEYELLTPGQRVEARAAEARVKQTAPQSSAVTAPARSSGLTCYESSISSPTPFMGNNDEVFRLVDGSVWEVKYEYEYLYEYYPTVVACPSSGRMIVGGKSLNVALLADASGTSGGGTQWEIYEETSIRGTVSGTIQRGHIFRTLSGNIYEVTGLTLQLVLELSPAVLVLRNGGNYRLIVDGFDEPLMCRKLNGGSGSSAPGGSLSAVTTTPAIIESRIDGEFDGWEGETVFKLQNGQIWQQSSYAYTYHYAYSPGVLIYKSGSIYKMRVDGIDDVITVQRINQE